MNTIYTIYINVHNTIYINAIYINVHNSLSQKPFAQVYVPRNVMCCVPLMVLI